MSMKSKNLSRSSQSIIKYKKKTILFENYIVLLNRSIENQLWISRGTVALEKIIRCRKCCPNLYKHLSWGVAFVIANNVTCRVDGFWMLLILQRGSVYWTAGWIGRHSKVGDVVWTLVCFWNLTGVVPVRLSRLTKTCLRTFERRKRVSSSIPWLTNCVK